MNSTSPLSFGDAPRSVLVVCTQRIGDVLLTTALVRSIKRQWPQAQIDMLVYQGTEGVLENNPDLRRVISVARRMRWSQRLVEAARLWRRYDLACATIGSSSCRLYAWAAGRKRVGLIEPHRAKRLSRFLLNRTALDEHKRVHTVTSYLALAPLVGITPRAEIVAPGIADEPGKRAAFETRLAPLQGRPFVVLHPYPMYRYKQWRLEGWAAMIAWLRDQGYAVALTGGPAAAEIEYAGSVAAAAGGFVLNLVGQLRLGETAELIRRAKLFIGPDTGATHIAAASGTPTLTLFGPSNPVRWGPWPAGWPAGQEPWPQIGSGRRGNVYVLQGEGACVPCGLEGCDRHRDSESKCLTGLDVSRVIEAAAQLLDLPLPKDARGPVAATWLKVDRG
ncbi:glycosyltransferase family 9 protein [Trinickia dinghuensis]|uniref:Lipopolysaccharide heptosyltransferase family protein n=1 Tax=Trinickia dinghuensis TaxID=2291023 RepID=A0A3D8JV18_9BURK|nr:glycosyltransferase family 9 protein [Trinickia dinghuensis]RDU96466.1 lipopolysaccharide heptosyltransferase family protein [Trinickia dinghuensis]